MNQKRRLQSNMPILRLKEIRDLSAEDRLDRLKEMRTELLRLRTMIRAGGTIENPARIGQLRMTIAQVLTVEHEQKLGIGKAKPEPEKPKAKKTKTELKDTGTEEVKTKPKTKKTDRKKSK
jgi:large subunit ribosomal protein L29